MNAKAMRDRTQKAIDDERMRKEREGAEVYEAVVAQIGAAADKGLYVITFTKRIPEPTEKQLKAEGYKLRDLGDNVANVMEISW